MDKGPSPTSTKLITVAHGSYYAVTGAWPLIHYPSFELITGTKIDVWLVQTVGLLLFTLGSTLLILRRHLETSAVLLLIAIALPLVIANIWFYAEGTLGLAYIFDAAVQLAIVLAWAGVLAKHYGFIRR